MMAVTALLFRWCPRRHQPAWSWLMFGSAVSVVQWFVVTLVMGLVFRVSHSFGDTYGPLAGIVALELWCMLSSMAILFGGAVAAQLEAERSGRSEPQDDVKIEQSEIFTDGDLICFRIGAGHFLWKMVRRIVGMLAEVGRGNLSDEGFARLLKFKSDAPAKFTAPPSGLYLEKVLYAGDVPPSERRALLLVR
jgi:hypothetical protein